MGSLPVEGGIHLFPLFLLPEEKKKKKHDATCTLGIFQHNCLKIAGAITAQFLFRKGFSSPACPGGRLRKWRLGRAGPRAGAMDPWTGATGPLPLLRPGPPPVSHLTRARLPRARGGGARDLLTLSSPGRHLSLGRASSPGAFQPPAVVWPWVPCAAPLCLDFPIWEVQRSTTLPCPL